MYVIAGASGNTGNSIARQLLKAGKKVKVISRSADKIQDLIGKGAVAAIGDLTDPGFLTEALQGATAAYLLIPPNFAVKKFGEYQRQTGDSITTAVKKSGVKNVVLLSSLGAHLEKGAGVVQELHVLEENLKSIDGLNLLILRPGLFMQNLIGNIGIIKSLGFLAGFPVKGDIKFPMIHVNDIGDFAAKKLLDLDFKGSVVQNLIGEILSFDEATDILGTAIGKPDLKWVAFSYEDAKNGMVHGGLQEDLANLYVEFSVAMNAGALNTDLKKAETVKTSTSFESFSKEFAQVFRQTLKEQSV